jgi:copper chaperone CopZ
MFASDQRGGRLRRSGVALAVVGALAVLALSAHDRRATQSPSQELSTKTVEIPVEGMTCVACAARVKKELASMGGVSDVEVSLAERRARIRFDPSRLSSEDLVAAITGLGYPAGVAAEAR